MAEDFTKSTLNYPITSPTPIRRFVDLRSPTVGDTKGYLIGDEWFDKLNSEWWKFAGKNSAGAIWLKIGQTGSLADSFTPDTGTSPVVPNASGNINIRGQSTPSTSGIRVSGSTNALNISMLSPFEGDFAFTQSTNPSSTERILSVTNSDTANSSSNSKLLLQVGGTSSGDPYTQYAVSNSRSWALGPDVSDSNIFKITTNNSGSVSPRTGTEILTATSNGIVTFPQNPSFYARRSTTLLAETGDGTQITILFDDVVTQTGGTNYNSSTGIFTSPATGLYAVAFSVSLANLQNSHNSGFFSLCVNGSTIGANDVKGLHGSFANMRASDDSLYFSCSDILHLSAGVTIQCELVVSNGPKTVDVDGTALTSFSAVRIA